MLHCRQKALTLFVLFSFIAITTITPVFSKDANDSIDGLLLSQKKGGLMGGLDGGDNNNNNNNQNQNPPADNTPPTNNNNNNNNNGNNATPANNNQANTPAAPLPPLQWQTTAETNPLRERALTQNQNTTNTDLTGTWKGKEDNAEYSVLHGRRNFSIRRPLASGDTQLYTGTYSPNGFDVSMNAHRSDFQRTNLPQQVIANLIRGNYQFKGKVYPAADGKTMKFVIYNDGFGYDPNTFKVMQVNRGQHGKTTVNLDFKGQRSIGVGKVSIDIRDWRRRRQQTLVSLKNRRNGIQNFLNNPNSQAQFQRHAQLTQQITQIKKDMEEKKIAGAKITEELKAMKARGLAKNDPDVKQAFEKRAQLRGEYDTLRLRGSRLDRELATLDSKAEAQSKLDFTLKMIPLHEKELVNPPYIDTVYVYTGTMGSSSQKSIDKVRFVSGKPKQSDTGMGTFYKSDARVLNVALFFHHNNFYTGDGEFPVDAFKVKIGGQELRYLGSGRGYIQASRSPKFYLPRAKANNWNVFGIPMRAIQPDSNGKINITVEYTGEEKFPGVNSMIQTIRTGYRP